MQSFVLTEVIDCGMLIVVTSSTFLKRKDMLKEKKAVSPDYQNPQPSIYRQMCLVHLYGLHIYCALVDLDSFGSPGVRPTPGLTSSTQAVCVCVRAYTSTHTSTTLTPAKNRKIYKTKPLFLPPPKHNLPRQKQALTMNKLKQTPLPIPPHTRMQVLRNTCDTRACSREIGQYK